MCYSAQIEAAYQKYVHEFGADIDIHEFVRLYGYRWPEWNKFPKAMREAFRKPRDEAGFELAKLVAEGDRAYEEGLRAELLKQQERLATAEAKLAGPRPTKTAAEEKRKAGNNIRAAERNLAKLARRELVPEDSRIFPDWYAPVLIVEDGRRIVRPMRYHCRPAALPACRNPSIEPKTERSAAPTTRAGTTWSGSGANSSGTPTAS